MSGTWLRPPFTVKRLTGRNTINILDGDGSIFIGATWPETVGGHRIIFMLTRWLANPYSELPRLQGHHLWINTRRFGPVDGQNVNLYMDIFSDQTQSWSAAIYHGGEIVSKGSSGTFKNALACFLNYKSSLINYQPLEALCGHNHHSS
jgi:hypothetical protein